MNLEFTKSYEKSDPTHPERKPMLYLGWKGRNGDENTLRYGAKKFNDILSVLDEVGTEIKSHDATTGIYTKEVVFHKGETFNQWREVFTEKKWAIYDHYKSDIKTYVDKYYEPYVPKGRQLYEKPLAEMYEDDKCNVKWVLRVPCFKAEANDIGAGLRAWNVSEFMANLLVKDGEGGRVYANVVAHKNDKKLKGTPYKFVHVFGLEEKPFELSPEQQDAFEKYYDTFLKFVINPTSLA